MRHIEILSLPKLLFAHVYHAKNYYNTVWNKDNLIEITYISDGSISITGRNGVFTAQKGDVTCCLHDEHSIVESDEYHEHHTICVEVEWKLWDKPTGGIALPARLSSENDTSRICHLIDNIIHNQALYKESPIKGAAKILELFCEIDKVHKEEQPVMGEYMYAKKVKEYVEDHIRQPITQNEIASELNISSGYLCSVFKKAEGLSVKKYINTTKLERIRSLMEREDVCLYEACELYGYSDPNYVSRLFKSLFGYNITDKPKVHPEIT